MSESIIASRYSKALFEIAQEQNKLDAVWEDLSELFDVYKKSEDVREIFLNPLMDETLKIKLLTACFQGKIDDILLRFLSFLAKKDRLNLLVYIFESFKKFMDDFKNQTRVVVQTVTELDEESKNLLLNKLKTITHKNILSQWNINPDMIGGIRVYAQGRLYEHSFKNELQDFKRKALERV